MCESHFFNSVNRTPHSLTCTHTNHIHKQQQYNDPRITGKDCVAGDYGRSFQFRDTAFSTSTQSMGACEVAGEVVEWRSSLGINSSAVLFAGGTDPDDVCQGRVKVSLMQRSSCIHPVFQPVILLQANRQKIAMSLSHILTTV